MTRKLGEGQDWQITWDAIRIETSSECLQNFRANKVIINRLVDKDNLRKYKTEYKKVDIPDLWLADTLIGNPKTTEITGKAGTPIKITPNSIRAAYCLDNITKHWREELAKLPTLRILEVGAGFGCFAEIAFRALPINKYYLIDSAPMLKLQKYYMTEAGCGDKCEFLHPHERPKEKVDLIISTMSLGEMEKAEVDRYIALFTEWLVPETGLLYLVQRTKRLPERAVGWEDYKFRVPWEVKVNDFAPLGHFTECFGRLRR